MNIEHLKLFVRIARMRNISRAGNELNLSPAVASSYINKLEEHLATRLIHRTTRKVSLTEDGEAFLPHAEEVLASVAAAQVSVGVGNNSPSGTLRITAPASFGRMHLIPLMKQFMDSYPDLQVDCRLSDGIVDLVEGGFDIAIRNSKLKSSSLIARRLAPDRRMLCASPEYIERMGEPKTPQELKLHQCIVLMGIDQWHFKTPKGATSIKVQGKFRTDSGEALRDTCVQGLGITINSYWSVYEFLKRGELIQVLEDHPILSETAIWAVYPSSRQLSPKVRAFIDFFSNAYGDKPYWEQPI